jgi:hypothetical protein
VQRPYQSKFWNPLADVFLQELGSSINAERYTQLEASTIPAQIIRCGADSLFDAALLLAWLQPNLGGRRPTGMVARAKLFFSEEHRRLVSVLLKEFWNSPN